jgi:hypothetical protein
LDHRLTNRQKIALSISKENFASLDFARFRRLSTAIGRFFSVCRRLIDSWSSKKDRREAIYRLVKIEVEVDRAPSSKRRLASTLRRSTTYRPTFSNAASPWSAATLSRSLQSRYARERDRREGIIIPRITA